jgi:hypothetical protein
MTSSPTSAMCIHSDDVTTPRITIIAQMGRTIADMAILQIQATKANKIYYHVSSVIRK